MKKKKMYALLSDQGTAMSLTGLCEEHLLPDHKKQTILNMISYDFNDWNSDGWQVCTGNTEIECQYCPTTEWWEDEGLTMEPA